MIQILQQPNLTNQTTLGSAGNDSFYSVSGTTYLQPNVFDYKFVAQIFVNGISTATLKSFPDPEFNQFGVFNLKNIVSNFVGADFLFEDADPISIFNNCPNSSARIYIEFGEEYTLASSTGSTFVQTGNVIQSNPVIYINSTLSFTDQENINLQNYLLGTSTIPSALFLDNKDLDYYGDLEFSVYTNQRKYVYFINDRSDTSGAKTATFIFVSTEDSSGSSVGEYQIFNPYTYLTATDVQSLAVGYPQLAALTSDQYTVLSGDPDIFGDSVTHYFVVLITAVDNIDQYFSQGLSFNILTDCGKYAPDAYTIHWLNPFGAMNSWLFNKRNETSIKRDNSSFQKIPGSLLSNGNYQINTYDTGVQNYYTILQDSIEINSDWLNDNEVVYLKDLFSSPVIYLEDQTGLLTSITLTDDSYTINKQVNQKLFQLKINVQSSNPDFRQRL